MKLRLFLIAGFLLAATSNSFAGPLFAPSYTASVVFNDALGGTSMTIAYDGSNYWSTSGGNSVGVREAQYDSSGALIGTFSPGLDFRSIFADAAGNVFARQFADSTIYKQTAPGTFVPYLTLSGPNPLDDQSAVVLNGAGTEYVAQIGGTVSRWDLTGASLGTVALSGYGTSGNEGLYPANRGIAVVDGYFLTYDAANQTLSAWDSSGVRVDQTILTGAGTGFDSDFSLSFANGMVFVIDAPGAPWRGYDIGLLSPIPEPATLTILGLGLAGLGLMRRKWAA